ncbi:hypothetical protein J7E96_33985 [Streptomyces sp. ISL-96]|uniref:hypothetical protein n=1 Tax=Streptomyces sp. ISL-96 TaxID=2819191 RepID=UPI001BEC53D2|nr:hypothetical protein [Streptomyces sp. ISL-96]MBT2493426.1 hypothetical protein [Streptomyces sp. ISL-96]
MLAAPADLGEGQQQFHGLDKPLVATLLMGGQAPYRVDHFLAVLLRLGEGQPLHGGVPRQAVVGVSGGQEALGAAEPEVAGDLQTAFERYGDCGRRRGARLMRAAGLQGRHRDSGT